MSRARVLITNWESSDNTGDLAILRAQTRYLEDESGSSVLILGNQPGVVVPASLQRLHVADSPWTSPVRGGMASWARGGCLCLVMLACPVASKCLPDAYAKVVRVVSNADIVMPEGGGYLNCDGSLRKVAFLARALFPLYLARRLGVRRALWGHSIGPVKGPVGRFLMRLALRGASIVVRDDASLGVCRELGLAASRAPDLALLTAEGLPRSRGRDATDARTRHIGVTVKRTSTVPAVQDAYVRAVADALRLIAEDIAEDGGAPVFHLIPQVVGPTQVEDDRPVLDRLATLVGDLPNHMEIPLRNLEKALELYGSLDFLLATRMHSAVLAACAGTPFAVFGYVGGKARGLVDDLGLPEWVTTSEASELPAVACRCYVSRASLAADIATGLTAARERIRALDVKDSPASA